MILSLFILALAAVIIALLFELLAQHLSPFLELALSCRTTFAFVISPFTAGGFPALESLCHIAVKLRLTLPYQNSYSIASKFFQAKEIRTSQSAGVANAKRLVPRKGYCRANAPLPPTK
jgi:hypothetical protein